MSELTIDLHSWIIQDGNYGDFAVGDVQKFALEFAGSSLASSGSRTPHLQHVGAGIYQACGEVIFVHPTVWVIDIGVKVFWESSIPPFAEMGSWVEGKILLGIAPFFYKEYLRKLPDIPNLFYEWTIKRISRNDTPLIETPNAQGGIVITRDNTREHWTDISKTDAWEDGNGSSTYLLHAVLKA